ncbi:MAG: hypothetical protein ACHRHE_09675 [Tepidisphaerales bacterium]
MSFPVQSGDSLLNVCRYLGRNALTGVVERAEDWPWSSLRAREHGTAKQKAVLSGWPTDRPKDWSDRVRSNRITRCVPVTFPNAI